MAKKPRERIDVESELFHRQQAYKAVFVENAPAVLEVLADLAEFCRANESTIPSDPKVLALDPHGRIHALMEGRREVWLRIARHLNLSSQKLFELYTGVKF